MDGKVIIDVFSPKRIAFRAVMNRQAPKIKVLLLCHRVEHLFEWADRSHQR